jgi:parallel beta-helix repeat protein
MGKGAYYTPDSRVYLTKPDGFIQTANEKFDDLDRADLEQKNRVDTLITENPQPSEVVDLRIDRNGVVFPVARDRVNAEQKKIEDAYEDLNSYKYPSLKERIDAEQGKIEEAYSDLNGKAFSSLKNRIDAEQKKIEDAYIDKNGVKFNSLKERIDSEQSKIEGAYVDKNGKVFTSLKGRIDSEQGKIEDAYKNTIENTTYTSLQSRLDIEYSQLKTKISKFYSVLDYGAVGDGKADDTAAFQKLLDIAKTNPIEVYIPPATYRLTDTLVVYGNTHIRASHAAVIEKDHDKALLVNGLSTDKISGYNGNGRITIEGGIWDCNGVSRPVESSCFVLGHALHIRVYNVEIRDVCGGHAIELNALNNVIIQNCRILGYKDPGGRDYSEAIQIDLAKSTDTFPWFGNYDNTVCKNVIIRNCMISSSSNLPSWGRGIGSHSATIGVNHEDILIDGNIIKDTAHWGIRIYSSSYVRVVNNYIGNCGGGIALDSPLTNDPKDTVDTSGNQTNASQDTFGFIVTNNNITGCGTYGSSISFTAESTGYLYDVLCSENTISSMTGTSVGIYAYYMARSSIINNKVNNINNTGISVHNSNRIRVDGNYVGNTGQNGITAIDNCYDITFSTNHIFDVKEHGIFASNNIDHLIVSANVVRKVGQKTANTYNHIRLTSGINNVVLMGNICKDEGNAAQYALYITDTVNTITRAANIFKGAGSTGSVYDTSGSTVSGDLV